MSLDKTYWMQKAISMAQKAPDQGEVPVGAILVYEEKRIGWGVNCRAGTQKTTGHAEIEALESYNQASQKWRFYPGTSLYVTVEPCLMCTGALLWARVDNIYFGCRDPKNAGLLRLLPDIEKGVFDHRFQNVEGGILQTECETLISSFFSKLRANKKARKENAIDSVSSLSVPLSPA